MANRKFSPISKAAQLAYKNGCSADLGRLVVLQEKFGISGETALNLIAALNAFDTFVEKDYCLHVNGISAITDERVRQFNREGFDGHHDSQHVNGELIQAAIYYCFAADKNIVNIQFPHNWAERYKKREGFPTPTNRDLIKAGALIAAELDRRLNAIKSVG